MWVVAALLTLAVVAQPTSGPLAIVRPAGDRPQLARIDARSLEPVLPFVFVGEYHWSSAVSPDGRLLALGVSAPSNEGRIGVDVVDLERMEKVARVATNIAAEGVSWLSDRRIVESLQRGGLVLADAASGEILRRWPDAFRLPELQPKPMARGREGVVFLLAHPSEVAPAKLVLVDDEENLHSVSLSRMPVSLGEAALAVDPENDRAFVMGTEPVLAEIDLESIEVSYRDVEGLAPKAALSSARHALFLDEGRLAVFGQDRVPEPRGRWGRIPAGVRLLDPSSGRARTLDADAPIAVLAPGKLLVYGGEESGLAAYSFQGLELFRSLAGERVLEVHVEDAEAIVRIRGAWRVVSLDDGSIVREPAPSSRLLEIVDASR